MRAFFDRYKVDIVVVALFAAIAFAYFVPADIEGRILYRHDTSAGRGAGVEADAYKASTGERTRWTNALFGGMPTYQTAPSYDSTELLGKAMDAYHLWLPENVWFVFVYLLGFYILLRAFDFRKELAALGSIIWAFSSYFFIIIAAGHIWKVWALAYLPPMIAGMVYAFRGRYLRGLVLMALFSAFEIKANHVQMTYYFLFVMLLMWLAYMEDLRTKHFWRATAVCVVGALIGVAINASTLYHTWQYAQESTRGAAMTSGSSVAGDTASRGMDRDYITAWSYGVDETLTLLVPNAKGGASVPLTRSTTAMAKADPDFYQIYQQLGQYWGDQPGTSGPVYVGAFVVMLFVLALIAVRGPMKWALVGATVLSIVLAWGRNFMVMTDFFLDYVPMYDKFRTVASILVIAEFTIPLLAVMALARVVSPVADGSQQAQDPNLKAKSQGSSPKNQILKPKTILIAYGITAGLCVLFALCPSLMGDYISLMEHHAMSGIPAEYLLPLEANLTAMRQAVFSADCWRSFLIITIGTVLLLLHMRGRLGSRTTIVLIALLCLVDMWQVNKRYLNDEMFVAKRALEQAQPMTDTDRQNLHDPTPDSPVSNLATNTFNENETSFYHKSLGGYHAAKLGRYQDIIDRYLQPEMREIMSAVMDAGGDMTAVKGDSLFPVVNALNTRYFILPLQGGQTVPLQNPYALGNAWLVDSVRYVSDGATELAAIGTIDLRHVAVADRQYEALLGTGEPQCGESRVTMTNYAPNELRYELQSEQGGVVLFSEVYYPGWTATIDGERATLARADYLLRALRVEAGEHELVLTFKPKSIRATETIAYVGYALLLAAVVWGVVRKRKEKSKE